MRYSKELAKLLMHICLCHRAV